MKIQGSLDDVEFQKGVEISTVDNEIMNMEIQGDWMYVSSVSIS